MANVRSSDRLGDVQAAVIRSKLLEDGARQEKSLSRSPGIAVGSRFVSAGVVIACAVGTGGIATAEYIQYRNERGLSFGEHQFKSPAPRTVSRQLVRTPAESLARVRESLKPSVTELAAIFGVSRQAIYYWQSGQPVAPQNQEILEDLAKAADLLIGSGVSASLRPLTRKLPGGRTMLELIKGGERPQAAARALIAMLKAESQQRESLTRRLSQRPPKPIDIEGIGSPHLDESA